MKSPIIFLDLDDVLVLNRQGAYGGYDVLLSSLPEEMWSRVFHEPATQVLVECTTEHQARVVMTTSWVRFMDRDRFEILFRRAGLSSVAFALHEQWEAPQLRGETRRGAIDRWLAAHHCGEAYVVLDDEISGTGLIGSAHEREGRLVLCREMVGLHRGHLPAIRAALGRPAQSQQ